MRRLFLILAVAAASCVPVKPTPTPIPVPTSHTEYVTVRGSDGAGLETAAALLTPDDGTGPYAASLAEGRYAFTVGPETHSGWGAWLHIAAPDYTPVDRRVSTHSGSGELLTEEPKEILLALSKVDLPRIVVRGRFFGLDNGARWTAIECTDFNLLARFLAGEDIEPVLSEREAIGFNLLRVWTLYDVGGIGHLVPDEIPNFYNRVPEFLNQVARHGMYVELTAFTGTGRLMPAQGDQQAHLNKLGNIVRAATNAILEVGNEYEQGDNPWSLDLDYPPGIVISAGSVGSEKWPTALGLPILSYEAFHTNLAFEWWRKEGHNAMELSDVSGRPTLTNESERYPDQDSSLQHATDAPAGSALLNGGSCYHSNAGKASVLFSPVERQAAAAWVAGARSVPLECQDGGYRHRTDLEVAGILRAYDRNVPGVDCAVRIRN